MKKILCPSDFSDTAQHGVAYAAKFAQATGSELILFHVQSRFDLTPLEILRGKELTMQAVSNQLEEQSREISKEFKISCYADVALSGRPFGQVINEKAQEDDLIIMGTNGADDYYQFFTGSNTYKVIRQSSTPLLLVPNEVDYASISKIVYAFDLLHARNYPLHQLMFWAKALHSEVCAIQVVQEHYTHELEMKLKKGQDEIKSVFDGDVSLQFETLWSDEIASTIHSYMVRTKSDALALCTQHYSFIEKIFHKSVIKYITSIARYPVFVFH